MTFVARPDHDFRADLPRREAARSLLRDVDGRILLLLHEPPLHVLHWAGAGGGLDQDESAEQALRRELAEELALPSGLPVRPVGAWRHAFLYRGRLVVQHESLFLVWLPQGVTPGAVTLGPRAGEDGITASRWWTPAELREAREDVWPDGLANWLDQHGAEASRR